MGTLPLILVACGLSYSVAAASPIATPWASNRPTVDLRVPHALEHLQKSDPVAYRKIEQIAAGLARRPARAESDWLQVKFHASDVSLLRHLYRTSLPPLQILGFTLDDVHYVMYVARTDLKGKFEKCDSDCATGRLLPVH